jgi:hypothetical protein
LKRLPQQVSKADKSVKQAVNGETADNGDEGEENKCSTSRDLHGRGKTVFALEVTRDVDNETAYIGVTGIRDRSLTHSLGFSFEDMDTCLVSSSRLAIIDERYGL